MTPDRLFEIYGPPSERAARKVIHSLDRHCRDFIAASPFIVLGTSDGTHLDVSPKGDPAGFVAIEDDTHLILPDRPGNNRVDGLLNILNHPKVAILFLIPSVNETLRINGTATIHDDPELCARHAMNGRSPLTVTRISIDEIFTHCGKAPLRSALWRPETWPSDRPVASLYEMIKEHAEMDVPEMSEDDITDMYKKTLY